MIPVVPTMTRAASSAWRPSLRGWSGDVLPFYDALARELEDNAIVVEVGVAFGRSALFLAEKLADLGKRGCRVVAVDPWDRDEGPFAGAWDAFLLHLSNAPPRERRLVHPMRCTSAQAARALGRERVACVFLDADHSEGGVLADLDAWGGIPDLLAGHDFGPHEPGVVSAVRARFGEADRVDGFVWQVQKRDLTGLY